MDGEQPLSFQSICHVRASELFPKTQFISEDDSIQIPFSSLCGEAIEDLGRTADGVLAISNYRLFVDADDEGFHNIPLGAIDTLEAKETLLYVFCKDGRSIRCTFQTSERCHDWLRRLSRATAPPKQIEDHFAFAFHAWAFEEEGEDIMSRLSVKQRATTFMDEVERLKFNLDGPWRISQANMEYKLCPSYPQLLLVPKAVSDAALEASAKFRVACRLPAVVWRHAVNGAVITRSSQPEVGLLGWRSTDDEELIHAVQAACAVDSSPNRETDHSRKVLIIDARSYSTAFVNRARGGGVECPEYYPDCEIEFMNLPNIHTIRRSFNALRLLCATPDNPSWWQLLDNTKWLNHIAGLLSAAVIAANAVDKQARPVLVHCSDGWDRTPQIVSLAQILLDPYYRTVEGFRALVQREWLDFGHKFGDRCGNSVTDLNDRCPVFLQWLDAIHQLLLQFPCNFQYSELFLVKLVQHTYSNMFGTFLCNSPRERSLMNIAERTFSIWPLLQDSKYLNLLYTENPKVLQPSCDVRDMTPWSQVFHGVPAHPKNSPNSPPTLIAENSSLPQLVTATQNRPGPPLEPVIGESETDCESCDYVVDSVPQPATTDSVDSVTLQATPNADETEATQDVITDIRRMVRLRPIRKNRTISEELYERYVGPLDQPAVCGSIENLNLNDMSFSQDSTSTLVHPGGTLSDGGGGTSNGYGSNGHSNGSVGPRLDIDGLQTNMDDVQVRVRSILDEHRARVLALERELQAARLALLHQRCQNTADQRSRPVSVCESDNNSSSLPSVQSLPSDQSWEAIDERERELRPTLWVPDHAVSTCNGCNCPFWIGRRKHHCRKCGNIFCSDCSEHTAILPGEDLYYPVRVCNSCHTQVETCVCCSPPTSAESGNDQPATVTNPVNLSEVEATDLTQDTQSRLKLNGLNSESDHGDPAKHRLSDITQLFNTVNGLKDEGTDEIQSRDERNGLNPSEVNGKQCGLEFNGFKSPLGDVANGQLGFVDETQPELGLNGVVAPASILPHL